MTAVSSGIFRLSAEACKISITSKRLDRLTALELNRINLLTLKNGSGMREDVLHQTKRRHEFQIFLARQGGVIVGWAVAFPPNRSSHFPSRLDNIFNVYTYVRIANRRMGVGSKLIHKAARWSERFGRRPKVFKWTEGSESFYNKCSESNRLKIINVL